ncbi:MAG: pectinesterase family protein [Clostridiales bacterium]|nr:pectinesterase family protein [Clostridiales bacterium]
MKNIVVAASGGDFATVGEAVDFADENSVIYIKKGVYREKTAIKKPGISLIGEDREKTVIVYGDYAMMEYENGYPIGTFKTPSMYVGEEAYGFTMKNLTVLNDAGEGNVVGQAVALYLDCDKAVVENCRLSARQDTLLCGSIPEDITGREPRLCRQYFKDCFIEGNVDFIFGGATALFENCDIFVIGRAGFPSGYVTAACTAKSISVGFVFKDCRVTGSGNRGRAFLGRPWRDFAKTVFIDCKWDDIIHPEVYSKWNNRKSHETCYYGFSGMDEFKDSKAEWVHYLTKEECKRYEAEAIFGDWCGEIFKKANR